MTSHENRSKVRFIYQSLHTRAFSVKTDSHSMNLCFVGKVVNHSGSLMCEKKGIWGNRSLVIIEALTWLFSNSNLDSLIPGFESC